MGSAFSLVPINHCHAHNKTKEIQRSRGPAALWRCTWGQAHLMGGEQRSGYSLPCNTQTLDTLLGLSALISFTNYMQNHPNENTYMYNVW